MRGYFLFGRERLPRLPRLPGVSGTTRPRKRRAMPQGPGCIKGSGVRSGWEGGWRGFGATIQSDCCRLQILRRGTRERRGCGRRAAPAPHRSPLLEPETRHGRALVGGVRSAGLQLKGAQRMGEKGLAGLRVDVV